MPSTTTLLNRNRQFAGNFASADLPILPKLRTVILTCADARVDPAHIFGLELGDAVVIRNNGGRVTPAVVEEIAALSFIVAQMEGGERPARSNWSSCITPNAVPNALPTRIYKVHSRRKPASTCLRWQLPTTS